MVVSKALFGTKQYITVLAVISCVFPDSCSRTIINLTEILHTSRLKIVAIETFISPVIIQDIYEYLFQTGRAIVFSTICALFLYMGSITCHLIQMIYH